MKFDNIFANPPYGRIGVKITEEIFEGDGEKDTQYSVLGTRQMTLAVQEKTFCSIAYTGFFVYLDNGERVEHRWVNQNIFLFWKNCNNQSHRYEWHNRFEPSGKFDPNDGWLYGRITYANALMPKSRVAGMEYTNFTRRWDTSLVRRFRTEEERYETWKKLSSYKPELSTLIDEGVLPEVINEYTEEKRQWHSSNYRQ